MASGEHCRFSRMYLVSACRGISVDWKSGGVLSPGPLLISVATSSLELLLRSGECGPSDAVRQRIAPTPHSSMRFAENHGRQYMDDLMMSRLRQMFFARHRANSHRRRRRCQTPHHVKCTFANLFELQRFGYSQNHPGCDAVRTDSWSQIRLAQQIFAF